MDSLLKATRGLLLTALLVGMGAGLGGCGEASAEQNLFDAAARASDPLQKALDAGRTNETTLRLLHEMVADALEISLADYPAADENLQRFVRDLRDGERQLAEGRITGAEAEALREQHLQWYAQLERGELPPEYR